MTNAGVDRNRIREYNTQSASRSPFAPSASAICGANAYPISPRTTDTASVTYTIREKYSFASSFFPSPRVMDTTALPPVPAMNPMVPTPISTGITRFSAAKGVFPTKLDTKNPSTILYIEVHNNIKMDGATKRSNRL